MQSRAEPRRSRRALLLGGIGGLAALAASALDRSPVARAANGDTVKVGQSHSGGAATSIQSSATAIVGSTTASSGKRAGVLGKASPGNGRGVMGQGPFGVVGQTGASSGVGVMGLANGSSAVGVLGKNNATTNESAGVRGESPQIGVVGRGTSSTGVGVLGSGARAGVIGRSGPGGVAGEFEATGDLEAIALSVRGRAEFTSSGKSEVASGADRKTISPGVNLTARSMVLATFQSPSGTAIDFVSMDVSAETFTIRFTGTTSQACTVAWFVLG